MDETQRHEREQQAAEARRKEEEELQESVHFARTEATLASITLQSQYEGAMREAADAEGAVAELMMDLAEQTGDVRLSAQLEEAAAVALASQKKTVSRLRQTRAYA